MSIHHSSNLAEADTLAGRTLDLVLALVGYRAWALACRHGMPAESYALLLSSSAEDRQLTMQGLRGNWKRTLLLESLRFRNQEAEELFQDLPTSHSTALRLVHMLYERSGFDIACRDAQCFLNGLLQTLPDGKVVEDLHNAVRQAAKKNPNAILRCANIQHIVCGAGVLEARGVKHPPMAPHTRERRCGAASVPRDILPRSSALARLRCFANSPWTVLRTG